MVIAATDDKELNHHIVGICNSKGIMVNAVDQKEDCSFIFSSYIKEKNLIAAFSSGGNSPVLAQYLKSQEKEILTPFLGELNEYMGKIRKRVIEKYDTEEKRKEISEDLQKHKLCDDRLLYSGQLKGYNVLKNHIIQIKKNL